MKARARVLWRGYEAGGRAVVRVRFIQTGMALVVWPDGLELVERGGVGGASGRAS